MMDAMIVCVRKQESWPAQRNFAVSIQVIE